MGSGCCLTPRPLKPGSESTFFLVWPSPSSSAARSSADRQAARVGLRSQGRRVCFQPAAIKLESPQTMIVEMYFPSIVLFGDEHIAKVSKMPTLRETSAFEDKSFTTRPADAGRVR